MTKQHLQENNMTQEQQERIIEIYGYDYSELDIPPQLRETLDEWKEWHGITQDENVEWN